MTSQLLWRYKLDKLSKEERHAFLEGFEHCALFSYKYMNQEGVRKLKQIIRCTKLVLEEYEISETFREKEDIE